MAVSLLSLSPAPLPPPLPPRVALSSLSPGPPPSPGVAGVRSFFDREWLASNRSRSRKVRPAEGDGATTDRKWHQRPDGPRVSPTTSGLRG